MTNNKKDLEKKQPAGVLARISGEKPAGLEEVDLKEDVIMPRVAILQGLSQLVIDKRGGMGDLANSVTKEVYGASIDFIPLFLFKTRVMFEVGKGLVVMSRDGITVSQASEEYQEYIGQQCLDLDLCQWQGGEPPRLSLVYNFPSVIIGRIKEFPISVSLMRTSAKAGKNLISMAMMGGEDIFARKYKLSTELQKNEMGTFAVANIELLGRCTDEEYAIAKNWYSMLRGKAVEVEMEEEQPNF